MTSLPVAALVAVAAAASATVPPPARAQAPEERAVREAIERHYLAAHATGVGASLRGWFVPDGRMMFVRDGALRIVPSETYIGGFPGVPAADEARRRRRVAMVDVAGDAAIARVELAYPDATIVDYFQLLKLDGEWKLVSKTFARLPAAP